MTHENASLLELSHGMNAVTEWCCFADLLALQKRILKPTLPREHSQHSDLFTQVTLTIFRSAFERRRGYTAA